jgi:hypothetical protein
VILHASATSPLCRFAAVGADVQIVDPPYAPKVHAKATSAGTGGRGVRKRDLGFGHLTPALMLRIAEYAAQVRRWSVVFTDLESVHLWIAAMRLQGVEYVRTVPWVRWSQPQLSGDRPPSGAEAIAIFHRGAGTKRDGTPKPIRKRWNGPGGRIAYRSEDVDADDLARAEYAAKSLRGRDKYSCEKPLDLMLALVSDYSDPGETVFDPCAGSGTTLLAARLLGREAFGLERVGAVAALGTDRVDAAFRAALTGNGAGLSDRDEERACRWIVETREETARVPVPKAANGSDQKTYERAQRRLADAERLVEYGSK